MDAAMAKIMRIDCGLHWEKHANLAAGIGKVITFSPQKF